MANVAIQETVVTRTKDGYSVQIYIADRPRGQLESPAISLALTAPVPASASPLLAEVQRAALQTIRDEMTSIFQSLSKEVEGRR